MNQLLNWKLIVTLEVPANVSGLLDSITVSEGETVEVGQILGSLKEGRKEKSKKDQENTNKDETYKSSEKRGELKF